MKKFLVEEDTTLKRFTDSHCIAASFCFRALLKEKQIKVNGNRASHDLSLKKGDEVVYYLTPAQEKKRGFTVLYEDENVVVCDKESGVDWEALLFSLSEGQPAYPVHRLDRNTEGVILFARTKEAQEELERAFRERKVVKIYLALVFGKMPRAHSVETAYLKKDEKNCRVYLSDVPPGEEIVTEYEVLRENDSDSLLKVTLHTGKTHQIRAHLAYLHHPIIGDQKYGDSSVNEKYHATRQRLISKELRVLCEGNLSYLKNFSFFSEKNFET